MQFNLRTLRQAVSLGQRAYREIKKIQGQSHRPQPHRSGANRHSAERAASSPQTGRGQNLYPGDYTGKVDFAYAPDADGAPDPGEIVWAWVPFEEDYTQGKDRPLLLVGRDREYLLGLMLTSKDKNNSAHHNRNYLDIGSGAWDPSHRDSEVKLDRVIRLLPSAMRREGAVMDHATFTRVEEAFNHLR